MRLKSSHSGRIRIPVRGAAKKQEATKQPKQRDRVPPKPGRRHGR